jgi:hypothetical protein
MSISRIARTQCAAIVLALFAADLALAKSPFILASGSRDPRIYAIDLNAALKPENNNTPNAIVARETKPAAEYHHAKLEEHSGSRSNPHRNFDLTPVRPK